jgi:hypothetical protein
MRTYPLAARRTPRRSPRRLPCLCATPSPLDGVLAAPVRLCVVASLADLRESRRGILERMGLRRPEGRGGERATGAGEIQRSASCARAPWPLAPPPPVDDAYGSQEGSWEDNGEDKARVPFHFIFILLGWALLGLLCATF